MKCWCACVVALTLSASAVAQSAGDGGGADVSVAMFTTHAVREVVLTPAGANAWTAKCERCAHVPLLREMRVSAPAELWAGGRVRVRDVGSGDERTAAGLWHVRGREVSSGAGELQVSPLRPVRLACGSLRASGREDSARRVGSDRDESAERVRSGGNDSCETVRSAPEDRASGLDVVLTLPSERYVEAVVSAESAAAEPAQSLRAMAVLARTYALNGTHYKARVGHLAAELCDSTQCQVLRLGDVSAAVQNAVWATAGETLWFGERRAEVFYSEDCGGMTEAAGAVWPGLRGLPYLAAHSDPYCVRRDRARWHAEVPLGALGEIAREEGWKLPQRIVAARVSERSGSQRALRVVFSGADGSEDVVAASALRFGIGRALGWNRVRSDGFDVIVRGDALVFDGRGFGHGVGLCQVGAAEMAREGKSAREILAFYFPGTEVRVGLRDGGWVDAVAGGVRVRSVETLSAARKEAVAMTWAEAQRRFAPRVSVVPEVVFAPTTEMFRQMSGEPGWMLGATRGAEIVLQPESVARGNERSVLLHEMLHVLVETEAGVRVPLWLREGLVEVLAGDGISPLRPVGEDRDGRGPGADGVERGLREPGSAEEARRAHAAAARLVAGLVARYGLGVVRGWVVSGVPAGVLAGR